MAYLSLLRLQLLLTAVPQINYFQGYLLKLLIGLVSVVYYLLLLVVLLEMVEFPQGI
jgi:hypothetical protein